MCICHCNADGTGYADHGREVFDDDFDQEDTEMDSANKYSGEVVTERLAWVVNIEKYMITVMKPIQSMFLASSKKTQNNKNVKLENDDLLDDILQEIELLPDSSIKQEIDSHTENYIPAVKHWQYNIKFVAGEKYIDFFWFDAYEDPSLQKGIIYLFGKVKTKENAYASCCLIVKNIERDIYILPRKTRLDTDGSDSGIEVTMKDVYEEFSEICNKNKIMTFRSRVTKKRYAFELKDVPVESEYLHVKYSAALPQIKSDMQGQTFSHVFGTNTSSLESFLLHNKIMGPNWLRIRNPQFPSQKVSYCRSETILSFSMKTIINPKTHENEIVAIAAVTHQSFYFDKPPPKSLFEGHFVVIRNLVDHNIPMGFRDFMKQKNINLEISSTERALLSFWLAKVQQIDPDIIVGHNICGFDIDVILHRMNTCKVSLWSRIGRIKRHAMPKLSSTVGGFGFADRSACCGRLICDAKTSAKELIRVKSYDLTELTSYVLKAKRFDINQDEIADKFNSMDATFALRIVYELNALPLALQITNIVGNVLSRTLLGGRSERNEFLLLHAFSEKDFVCPDKSFKKKQQFNEEFEDHDDAAKSNNRRKKPAYSGGLVLEPKKGFYDKYILLLDFNSLYPTIIQEFNICLTTVDRHHLAADENNDNELECEYPSPDLEPGVLPLILKGLVERRREYGHLYLRLIFLIHRLVLQYDIRQKALKLTANSLYGCLGFSNSRFYAKPLAALVTSKGREILTKAKELVENQMLLEVIYGDTDSIMINTNSTNLDEAYNLGHKVKAEINKSHRLLEIDIDGVFKSMLLLKKKKYAALAIQKNEDGTLSEVKELKGLDIVRRDWCQLAKDVGNYALSQILSSDSRENIVDKIHSYLTEVGDDVRSGRIDIDKYVILKTLSKSPNDYPDKKSLPHIHVALWMQTENRRVQIGDAVPYVICDDGSQLNVAQRAFHPDQFRRSDSLKIDFKYYLAYQIHPVVSRLCDPIEGTDSARIADCLGLDGSQYKHKSYSAEQNESDAMLGDMHMSLEEQFKNVEPLKISCPKCKVTEDFAGAYNKTTKQSGLVCPHCNSNYNVVTIQNKVVSEIRKFIKTYYQNWMQCDDPSCDYKMRQAPYFISGRTIRCPACERGHLTLTYSEKSLYNQILYYQHLFDIDQIEKGIRIDQNIKADFKNLYGTVNKIISRNGYSEINLSKLFQRLFTGPAKR
ncbi:uncharacterized protein TRIADDRAFT_49541 [Trichoplax adhaerens]|uniref:DNA polymerase n=1 Tax=Trichoplax adhaerens TaxID=10228 RepID=B3RI52_TRIAD|nr:hypothetical protein TRIADDRAFT_49541 [Trichoplax adhaerens]EDV28392.1 hypothetical protein TRIADDRAFT_49541 [Trichoplax adhaerens]|eukprot:XP_002107594.1 hypothetical protein TRIADDRAFT_49541 [Trichoplax adhaerens]